MGAKFFYRNIDLVYFVNNKLINNNLITQKDRMLLSFSGGQDSICFIFILNQLYSQLEFDITFFWCHHLWQTDSFYLMQQITKLSLLLQFNSCFPIPLNSISSELLARKWRQRCSYRVSLFYNYSKICLAHTFNDKVENIFLNFIRGTGLIGLAPLRWTQFISKSNITNEKPLSCFTPIPLTQCFAYPPHVHSLWGIGVKHAKGYVASLKPNGSAASDMCILQDNSDSLKNLTKHVIRKFIQRDSLPSALLRIPLRGKQKGIKMNLPQLAQRERDVLLTFVEFAPNSVSTGVTNEYKTKSCRAFTCVRSSATLVYEAKGLSSNAQLRGKDKSSICKIWAPYPQLRTPSTLLCTQKSTQIEDLQGVCKTSSVPLKHGKQLLNCRKDCYIVRPLLSISRIELNKICYFWKLPIYPDKSNQKVKFFRNRVRGQLLPTIKLFFNLNIENIFLQLAKIIETEDYCLTQIVNEFTKNTRVYHTKLNIYSKKK